MSIFEYDEEAHLRSEREIWREEGITQGITQGICRSIMELLDELGEIPDSLRIRLEAETDAVRLSRIHKMAARASGMQEFLDTMQLGGEL